MKYRALWYRPLSWAVILIALISITVWLEYFYQPRQQKKKENLQKVFQVATQKIRKLSLQKKGAKQRIEFQNDQDSSKNWQITFPRKLSVDELHFESFFSALNRLSFTETLPLTFPSSEIEQKDTILKEYGVDFISRKTAPQLSIEVDSQIQTLYIGLPHPVDSSVFALLDQGKKTKVCLIPQSFAKNLENDLIYWRDKKLFHLATHEIQKLKLVSLPQSSIECEKKDYQWILTTHQRHYPGDPQKISSLLNAFADSSAKAFIFEDQHHPEAKKFIKNIQQKLQLMIPSAQQTFTFYEKNNKVYLIASHLAPVYEVYPYLLTQLSKKLEDLQDCKLINHEEKIRTKIIEISGPTWETLTFQCQQEQWEKISSKQDVTPHIKTLLKNFNQDIIHQFLQTLPVFPSHTPQTIITLKDQESSSFIKKITFWKHSQKVYGKLEKGKDTNLFLIKTPFIEKLPWEKSFFEPRPQKKENKA